MIFKVVRVSIPPDVHSLIRILLRQLTASGHRSTPQNHCSLGCKQTTTWTSPVRGSGQRPGASACLDGPEGCPIGEFKQFI